MFGKPAQALGIAGAGLVGSIVDDLGLFDLQAQADEVDPLGSSRKRFEQLQAKQAKGKGLTRAEREEQNTYLSIIANAQKAKMDAETAKQSAIDAAAQKEYNAKVDRAMQVRDDELARDVRFSDTETGKWYKENATWLPFAAAYGGGMASRLFTGPGKSTTGQVFKDWLLPMFGGTTASFGAQNAPEIYDMKQTPSLNPEREAYRKAALELPEGHPDKKTWETYAGDLDVENPVKKAATQTLNDNLSMTGLTALAEGIGLGKFGAGTVNLPRRLINDAQNKTKGGTSGAGSTSGGTGSGSTGSGSQSQRSSWRGAFGQTPPPPPGSNTGVYRSYGDLPDGVKEQVRKDYIAARAVTGHGSISPKKGANAIRSDLAADGITVPVTAPRVKETNRAVDAFYNATGRYPRPDEYAKVFNDQTLAIPFALGLGGLGYGALDDREEFANGGSVGEPVTVGPLHSRVPGRTDALAITVPEGAFVIPADVVAYLGESNSTAGLDRVSDMFPSPRALRANGGTVPIAAAGGEYVLSPETVMQIGGGDLKRGHNALDAWVVKTRRDHINHLKRLPRPEK